MWLEQVTLKDFRCFYGESIIELSQDPNKNVTIVHAESGLGKTTVLNALLWCFYGETTLRFERRDELLNYDARAAGRKHAFVEVLFEHNGHRYRSRRYTKGGNGEREFLVMRIDDGSHHTLPNPDAFINTVIPKGMAGHFLFDGEYAEVFLGEDNRGNIRRAVQDILGCSLIKTAIQDLGETATYYRRQMPTTKASSMEAVSSRIDALTTQIQQAVAALDALCGDIERIEQQIADIDDKLRNSAAAKQLQARRDKATSELARARKREAEAQAEVLKWLGDNGRFLVSTRITDLAMDYLDQNEVKGRIPAPYNEELVSDLLEMQKCICDRDLEPGTAAYAAVQGLLKKAANATLRSRIMKVRAQLSQFRSERVKAPGRLDAANARLVEARQDISQHEADLQEISEQLSGINFDEIAEREVKRNELRKLANLKREQVGNLKTGIQNAESEKASAARELLKLAQDNSGSRVFMKRYTLCETLKGRLESELQEEEKAARKVLRHSIRAVLEKTSRKAFRLQMTDDYGISLVNEAGTQLPKTSGENQLLGLAFTAALVQFAKLRQNAQDHRLLRGTVAPLVLDSPFGQLDESYRRTTAEYIPQMAGQVLLMVTSSQASRSVMDAIKDRIGEQYVLIRHNRDPRGKRPLEIQQFSGKDVETAVFDAAFDGSTFVRIAH